MKYRNTKGEQSGFTILETLLFVAISSALIVIPFTIFNRRNKDVQFTDSIRTIYSTMTEQYNNVVSGSSAQDIGDCTYTGSTTNHNTTGILDYDFDGSPANNGSCIVLGTIIEFAYVNIYNGTEAKVQRSTEDVAIMKIHPIVGRHLTESELADCMASGPASAENTVYESRRMMYCLMPQVQLEADNVTPKTKTIKLPWGVTVSGTGYYQASSVGYFRDVRSSRVLPVGYRNGFNDFNSADSGSKPEKAYLGKTVPNGPGKFKILSDTVVDAEYSGFICLNDSENGRSARIVSGSSAEQEVIDLNYYEEPNCGYYPEG